MLRMRMVVALLVLCVIVPFASLAEPSLVAGDFELHLKDATSLYTPEGLPRQSGFFTTPKPGFAPDLPTVGDESRSILWVDAITQSGGTVGMGVGEMVALLQDLYIDNSSVLVGPLLLLNFTNSTASEAGVAPKITFWFDPTPDNVDGVAGITRSDTFDPYNDQKAPTYWVKNGFAAGIDSFPNVNVAGGVNPVPEDATIWLQCELVPLYTDTDGSPIYLQTFQNTAGPNNGEGGTLGNAYLKITGGSFAPSLTKGAYLDGAADLTCRFTTAANPNPDYLTVLPFAFEGGWGLESSDPIQGKVSDQQEEPAALGDFVWEDLNKNGIQDDGEPGIPDVTVNLYTCADVFVATMQTDADGKYLFDNLTPGDYYVEFIAPAGYVFTLQDQGADDAKDSDAHDSEPDGIATTICTTLESGETDLTWDAGLFRPAALGDFVWEDLNKNGIQDDGEPGVPDVTVNLYTCADVFVATQQTDADGKYLFDNLMPGSYYVEFILPTGYTFTLRDQGADDAKDSDPDTTTGKTICTTLESNETDLTWDAGLICLIDLELTKEGEIEPIENGDDPCCPKTPGYWKNHRGEWPVDCLVIGCRKFNATELMNMLNGKTPKGCKASDDVSVKLAKFVIATRFSLLKCGVEPCEKIECVLKAADGWLKCYPPGSDPCGLAAWIMEALKNKLDWFLNNGCDCNKCGDNGGDADAFKACFTITLFNRGPCDATGVKVTDKLPAGIAFLSAVPSQGTYDEATGIWDVGSLAKDATATLELCGKITVCDTYVNTAEVTAADQMDVDSTPNNHDPLEDDQDSAEVSCEKEKIIDLELDKTACVVNAVCPRTPGYWKNHTSNWPVDTLLIGCINYNKWQLLNLLNDKTPGGCYKPTDMSVKLAKFLVAAKLSLAAGAESCNDIDDVIKKADAFLKCYPPGSNPCGYAYWYAECLKDKIDRWLNHCCSSDCTVTFTIKVCNKGPDEATGVKATDNLPANVEFVSSEASQGTYDAVTGLWDIGSLAKDACATLKIVVKVELPWCGSVCVTNTAEVTAADQTDLDSTPNNHVASEDDQDCATVTCTKVSDNHNCDNWRR